MFGGGKEGGKLEDLVEVISLLLLRHPEMTDDPHAMPCCKGQRKYPGSRVQPVQHEYCLDPFRFITYRSTRLIVYSGIVHRHDRLSSEMKHKKGGRRDNLPA